MTNWVQGFSCRDGNQSYIQSLTYSHIALNQISKIPLEGQLSNLPPSRVICLGKSCLMLLVPGYPSTIGMRSKTYPWEGKRYTAPSTTTFHLFAEGIHLQLPNTYVLEFFLNKKKLWYIAAFIYSLLNSIFTEVNFISSPQYEFPRVNQEDSLTLSA